MSRERESREREAAVAWLQEAARDSFPAVYRFRRNRNQKRTAMTNAMIQVRGSVSRTVSSMAARADARLENAPPPPPLTAPY
jgi:hypothetical protein